jgi:hypothetical protein
MYTMSMQLRDKFRLLAMGLLLAPHPAASLFILFRNPRE